MNGEYEPKATNLFVRKLRNSPDVTWVSCLDPDHFKFQLVPPSFNQSPLNKSDKELLKRAQIKSDQTRM